MSSETKAVLGCMRCGRRYSLVDVKSGLYQIETFVCSHCYAEMQKMPYQKSCFGKPMLMLPSGKKESGYSSRAWECTTTCPDRNICRRVIFGVEKEEPCDD